MVFGLFFVFSHFYIRSLVYTLHPLVLFFYVLFSFCHFIFIFGRWSIPSESKSPSQGTWGAGGEPLRLLPDELLPFMFFFLLKEIKKLKSVDTELIDQLGELLRLLPDELLPSLFPGENKIKKSQKCWFRAYQSIKREPPAPSTWWASPFSAFSAKRNKFFSSKVLIQTLLIK